MTNVPQGVIEAIKEYLQWRRDEVYSTELFTTPNYDEVKDKIGETELTRLSADISRRNALSILEWIGENIETQQDAPITPEFLEGLGLGFVDTGNNSMATNLKRGYLSVEFIGGICMGCYFEIGISFLELPHIRTQSQLTNLIAALFGGGE